MADKHRYERNIGPRLDELDERFRVVEERLSRIESRVGIAAAMPATPPAEAQKPIITAAAPPSAPLVAPHMPRHEVPAEPHPMPETRTAHVPPVELVTTSVTKEPVPRRAEAPWPAPTPSTFGDLEQRFTGRLLAWIGGLALIVGAVFFLSLAFSRGWIGPTTRVIIGLVAGTLVVAAAGWFFEREDRLFGHVLTPVGLGVLSLSFFAGTQLYNVFPIEVGLAGALVSAVAVAVIAIRANSQLIAAYGLVTAIGAPILLQASPSTSTIAFLSAALIGSTVVALYRTWNWLPAIAFLLAAPQVSDFVHGDVSIAVGMTGLSAFWLLNAVAAGGEEFRVRRNRLGITSTTLLVANAAFIVGWGFYLLQGDAEWGRGLFLVALAAAHLTLGGYFLAMRGDHHPFGMLAFGTGIAAASMALPVQLGGPPVPLGWAAEAGALAWLYGYRKHGYAGLMSLALGAMAIGHLILFEYPWESIEKASSSAWPFVNANGGTLAFILGALAVAIYFARSWRIGIPAAAVGGALVVYAMPFETSGLLLIGGWSVVWLALYAVEHYLLEPRVEPVRPGDNIVLFAALKSVVIVGVAALLAAFFKMLSIQMASIDANPNGPATPFWDRSTAAAAIVLASLLAAGIVARRAQSRRRLATLAFGIVGFMVAVELWDSAKVVVAWSIIATASLLLARVDPAAIRRYGIIAGALVALSVSFVLTDIATPDRLVVSASSTVDHPFLWSGATASIGATVLVLILAATVFRHDRIEPYLWALAGVGLVYLLSVAVVDDFQHRMGGATTLEELQKQAQVALSILWAILGGLTLVAGLWRGIGLIRGAGLALLALVTAKVFLYDLSSLDAAYRVLSFIGLGVLLLISAYLYQHIGPRGQRPSAA